MNLRGALLRAAGVGLWFSLVNATSNSSSGGFLPIVDLGYELHQASYFNETGQFYNFSNIRYAAPPLGNLRFAAPQLPAFNRNGIQTGSVGRMCPQAQAAWQAYIPQFLGQYLGGQPINVSLPVGGPQQPPPADPRMTEDCLFLDVVVPKVVLENANRGTGVPVLVWIYGGGFATGDKSGFNPAGLLRRTNDTVIYVALNYRLGAFGWLSGPTFQTNGTANAGLHDQRFALEWVRRYIKTFGGDPARVTLFGESAGGGSVQHQITAYGGKKGPSLFSKAILQSPAYYPIASNNQQEQILNAFLTLLNVSTIQQARGLSSAALIAANNAQVAVSNYGTFTYGPAVDGDFVPALPGVLFLHGEFDHNLSIMVGHNSLEGLLFTSPFNNNDAAYRQDLISKLPDVSPAVLDYIATVLYPPRYDGSQPYRNAIDRAILTTAELLFTCNTFYLDTAYNNRTYAYYFTVPPGLHGEDIPYTYYNDGGISPPDPAQLQGGVSNVTVALVLQNWIVTFATTGVPTTPGIQGIPPFKMYGPDAYVINLGQDSIVAARDDVANARCRWWQKALYY